MVYLNAVNCVTMTMKLVILLNFMLIGFFGYAQPSYSYGFKLSGGISKVSMTGEASNFQNNYAPSGSIGVFYQTQVGTRGLFGIEGRASQIEGRWESNSSYTDGNGNLVTLNTIGKQHITQFQFPVYGGITIENISFYTGPQVGLNLAGTGSDVTTIVSGGSSETSDNSGELNIKPLDYGAILGIIWRASKKVNIEASYYYGAANIFDNSGNTEYVWSTSQILLGLRFSLRNVNDCGTCPVWK